MSGKVGDPRPAGNYPHQQSLGKPMTPNWQPSGNPSPPAQSEPARVSGRSTKGQTSKYKGGRKSRASRRVSRKRRMTRRR